MELEKLTHTGEKTGEFLETIHALADGDTFRDEPTAFTREVGINDRTGPVALKELEIVNLIVDMLERRKRKYSTFEPSQHLQPIYNILRELRRFCRGNRNSTFALLQPIYNVLQELQKSSPGNKYSASTPSQPSQPIYPLRGLRRSHPGDRNSTFAHLQSLQPIYNILQTLQKSPQGNGELTPEEK